MNKMIAESDSNWSYGSGSTDVPPEEPYEESNDAVHLARPRIDLEGEKALDALKLIDYGATE